MKMTLTPVRDHSFIRGFIMIYKNSPCLWQFSCPEYKCRYTKEKAYKKLLDFFQTYDPEATKNIVVRKIASLRSAFRKENNKIKESEAKSISPDDVYKPQLWYFDIMSFVKNQEEKRKNDSASEEEEEEIDNDNQVDPLIKNETFVTEEDEIMLDMDDIVPNYHSSAPPTSSSFNIPPTRITIANNHAPLSPNTTSHYHTIPAPVTTSNYHDLLSTVSTSKREHDAFGLFVAQRLSKMNDQQRLLCEDLITQVTSSGIKQKLTENTIIVYK